MLKVKENKGITLIALIITIIVMLILVGVTINVALNGGLFSKAEEATTKTKIAQVQEALTIKKAEIIAENKRTVSEYNLTVNDLTMSNELKNEFSDKLIIGKDGILYYNSAVVTNEDEQNIFKSMGINPYVDTGVDDPEGGAGEPEGNEPTETVYSFTLNELGTYTKDTGDSAFYFKLSNVWSAVGADLSENSDYHYQLSGTNYFILESNNEKFIDIMGITAGIFSIAEENEIGVTSYIDGEDLWVKIVGSDGSDLLVASPSEGQMTHEEFMELYGNVEFSFVKVSDYLQ